MGEAVLRMRVRTSCAWLLAGAFVLGLGAPAARAADVPPPGQDPFYRYDGRKPLEDIEPGTVLKTRTLPYHVVGGPSKVTAVQLLYRSTGQIGQPTVNVTSILKPNTPAETPKLLAYQSFYDSLNPNDEPSYAVSGGLTFGGIVPSVESALIFPFLSQGYTVAVADTEGQRADFAAGPEYGMNTLDGLRAAYNSPATGLTRDAPVGMIGYSGGAIATEWAAELAPTYAPEVDRNLIGAAMGGVLVHPAHNLHYVDGSTVWAGVIPMAVVGVARAFEIDLKPYLNEKGLRINERLQDDSIAQVLGFYPKLTWASLAKPEYAVPESVPAYVEVVNKLIMGTGGTPTTPLFIGQGANGELEGTPGTTPGIGPGDGVMVAGDVRSLARQYCDAGVTVQYRQYDNGSHVTSAIFWLPAAIGWLTDRFEGKAAPENCADIAPGNSLAPVQPAG